MRWWQWLLLAVAALLALAALWCVSEAIRRLAYSLAVFVLFVALAASS